jgi:hypothetical protein
MEVEWDATTDVAVASGLSLVLAVEPSPGK